jgi:uncharacterized protein (TIGR02145 family)
MTGVTTFHPANDDVYISGTFQNQWAKPGDDPAYRMTDSGNNRYSITLSLEKDDTCEYKFAKVHNDQASWDSAEWAGGPNRTIVVHETTSVLIPWASCPQLPVVSHAGQDYKTLQIGQQCWFRENLNIGERITSSTAQTNNSKIEKYCYDNLDANCNTYGGLYQWGELMQYATTEGSQGICPDDWHVPTENEWNTLIGNSGGASAAGLKMKSTTGWSNSGNGTNSSSFTVLPGGYSKPEGTFSDAGNDAGFWSSSVYPGYPYGMEFEIRYSSNDVFTSALVKTYGFSVRCIHD